MASAALKLELKCSVCLNLYEEPITLPCGHTFCKQCIQKTAQASHLLTCPECRHKLPHDIKLRRNTKMCSILEHLTSRLSKQDGRNNSCSYCECPAAKLCLDCETPLCDIHLERHTVHHVLTDLSTALPSRKCSVHQELYKYYCTEDGVCICATCGLIGDHKGHTAEKLSTISTKEKGILKMLEDQLTLEKTETEKGLELVKKLKEGEIAKTATIRHQVIGLIEDMKKELEAMEHRILCDITKEEEEMIDQLSKVIQQMEDQISALCAQMTKVQSLCNSTDPLTVLERKSSYVDRATALIYNVEDLSVRELNESLISVSLLTCLRKFTKSLPSLQMKRGFHTLDATDGFLPLSIITKELPGSFVLSLDGQNIDSSQSTTSAMTVSSGQHYWEVGTSDTPCWLVGVSYLNENDDTLGYNSDSWGLFLTDHMQYKAIHNGYQVPVLADSAVKVLGMYLDYEAGTLSFYQLSGSVKYLCSMHAKFTHPLHFAFGVKQGGWIRK